MFYEYTYPTYFYQHLHNQFGTVILKTGRILGILALDFGPDGQTVTRGSKALIIWSNFALLIHVFCYLSYSIYVVVFLKRDGLYFNVLSLILGIIQDAIYAVLICVTFCSAIFGRGYILKVVIFAKNLKNLFALLESDKGGNCQKNLLYANCANTAVDFFFVITVGIVLTINAILEPSLVGFMTLILETLSWFTYAYLLSVYCITFSFGYFLLQKLFINLSPEECHLLSIHHYLLLKFLRKVNFFTQAMLLVMLFDGFVGLVSDVSSDLF